MQNIKIALLEAKGLIETYLSELGGTANEAWDSVEHIVRSLSIGCECDDYNGFDCGCTRRAYIRDEALKEIEEVRKIYQKGEIYE